MLKRWNASARLFDAKASIGRFGALLSVAMIIVAAVALYRVLRDIDPHGLVVAFKAIDLRTIATSSIFVAAGYLTLTFYDLFALRTIGRREVPYRVAALASFTELFRRAQCRRQRFFRRRGPLSHLFGLGLERP